MTTKTVARKATPKKSVKKIDITKLSPKQLNAMDEASFVASLPVGLRRWTEAAWKLKGAL